MNWRSAVAIIHDALAIIVAWSAAYWLRFNFDIPQNFFDGMLNTLVWILPIQLLVLWWFGVYRSFWRYVSLVDLKRIIVSVTISALLVSTLVLMSGVGFVPRSVLIIQPLLLVLMMGGTRFVYRMWRERNLYGPIELDGKPVLVMGAGDAAVRLLREFSRSSEWQIVGLLDDDESKHGRHIDAVEVLGPLKDIGLFAKREQVEQVIIAMPSVTPLARRRAAQAASTAGLTVLTVPAIEDLLSGRVTVSDIRRVEVEDLLGREVVKLDDPGLHQFLESKVVLITGAGGSIGSELSRQVASYSPKKLILVDHSEFNLYQIDRELNQTPSIPCVPLLGDVRDSGYMKHVFETTSPDVIIHAAAYKHVPLLETNVIQGVRTNVYGTQVLADLASEFGVEEFLLISTDKAVNPTNVLGASKRIAEIYCQNINQRSRTTFITVRFGNVLGSAGSVIPIFREQITKGGPVTVTHPEISRYFMTIPESVSLILQSGAMGKGGEIYVLDMGEPVKITDLAEQMIRLSGHEPNVDIEIQYTGLRPGEKLHEELFHSDEDL